MSLLFASCGRLVGLRPFADLKRSLRPYNSVAAYLLSHRAPHAHFAPDAIQVTASLLNDFQGLRCSCEILVELLLRGYEWEQVLEVCLRLVPRRSRNCNLQWHAFIPDF